MANKWINQDNIVFVICLLVFFIVLFILPELDDQQTVEKVDENPVDLSAYISKHKLATSKPW